MMDCHRRIEHFLGVLERVAEHSGADPLGEEAERALMVALEYFRHAAPKHTADEEISLLPRMHSLADPALAEVLSDAKQIEADHRRAAAMHEWIDLSASRWLDRGALDSDEAATLRSTLRTLRELYRRHIAFEEERLFPAAAESLGSDALAEMGREMAARRNAIPRFYQED